MSLISVSQAGAAYDSAGRGDLSLVLTGYAGNEEQVLRLRNANRSTVQTREYLDWRYRQLPDMPPPCIAWLMSAGGEAVGMAAAIFWGLWGGGGVGDVAVVRGMSFG